MIDRSLLPISILTIFIMVPQMIFGQGSAHAHSEQITIAAPLADTKTKSVYSEDEDLDLVEFNFENADMNSLLGQISFLYDVTFITDDVLDPLGEGKKTVRGNKITFKTNKPLARQAGWDLFLTFLEMSGFSLIQQSSHIYRVLPLENAKKSAIPTYIGTPLKDIPQNEQLIRYMYFIENSSIEVIEPIVDSLRSSASSFKSLRDIQAFLLTDKAANIISLMHIVKELDKVTLPQSMSLLKLRRADALEVKKLYETLTQVEDKGVASKLFPARKQSTALYFPENARLIADPRTNTLIILGTRDAIKRIEDFVTTYVDTDLVTPYAPVRIHNLKYAEAKRVADILNNMVDFGKSTEAGKNGGIRGGDKYLKRMKFTPEPESNRLIVQGDEEDYFYVKPIIDKLDQRQPQVEIEVLILNITVNDSKSLGAQIRKKIPGMDGLLGDTVTFQTSGLNNGLEQKGIVTQADPTTGTQRLLADLIVLAIGAPAGNTMLSLGRDMNGIWGMFQALQQITSTQVVANPFLVATNKTPAKVAIGQTRRVVVSNVIGQTTENSRDDLDAKLEVNITPQINSDGMIILDLKIDINQFTDTLDFSNGNRNLKTIKTSTVVSNGEVLALGGLVQNRTNTSMTKTPWLGSIPIFGWLFKNKLVSETKDNLLIMITSKILPTDSDQEVNKFTNQRIVGYHTTLGEMMNVSTPKDPVDTMYFGDSKNSVNMVMDDFLFNRHRNTNDLPVKNVRTSVRNDRARKRGKRNRISRNRKKRDLVLTEQQNKLDNVPENNANSGIPDKKNVVSRKSLTNLVQEQIDGERV